MAQSGVLGKRPRADSVLGNRMDEHLSYKRLKSGSDHWRKLSKLIQKPTTQLCLIEAPKGVSMHFITLYR